MNLFFRLLFTTLISRFRSKVSIMGPCLTPFRCLPTDLDVLRHMNNGKYLSLMDLARVDLMARAGVMNKINQQGWYPVVVAETIRFKKSIEPFDRFAIETVILGWDEKAFLLRQTFIRSDVIVAEAVVRARFLKKTGGSVSAAEVLNLAGVSMTSPPIEPWVAQWNQSQISP